MAITPRIRTAVVPAAGQGTRMLPATKAVPKELLPIMERPALQFIVEEALGAGVDHLVMVTSRTKPAIEEYFSPSTQVEKALDVQGRSALADELRRIGRDVRVSFVYQDEPRGLGHAVGCARSAVGDESFFVLLPDELMEDSSLLISMANVHAETESGVVAVKSMERHELSRYGIVSLVGDREFRNGAMTAPIADIVEKPNIDEAPSDLAIIGRYVLTPDIFDVLEDLPPSASGEIQLTDALNVQAARRPLFGLISEIGRWDVGSPRGWVEAVIAVGLSHPDFGEQLRDWIRNDVANGERALKSPGHDRRRK
jgi:UTP--glucose-1-phosphate uridylyltransferase